MKEGWKITLAFIAGGGLIQIGNLVTTVSDTAEKWLKAKPKKVIEETDSTKNQAIDYTKPKINIRNK